MSAAGTIRAGTNLALKVPPHRHAATVAFWRDAVGLAPVARDGDSIAFRFGAMRLWIDAVPSASHAEIWLELEVDDRAAATARLEAAGAVRCDAIEPLPAGLRGGWIADPAGVVVLLREPG